MKISAIGKENFEAVKNILEKSGISSILKQKEIELDDVYDMENRELQELFGNAYLEIFQYLTKLRKDKFNGDIEEIKRKIDFYLSVFFDENPHREIGEHLRERQKEAVIKILDFIFYEKEAGGYIHFATGTGKTVLFSNVIKNIISKKTDAKVLVITPNKEALNRSKEEFSECCLSFGEYSGETKTLKENLTIATAQSLMNSENFRHSDYDLVICDEAHERFLGEKTSAFMQGFTCKKIGFTATAELKDKSVEQLFPKIIDEYLIDEAIKNKELPNINAKTVLEIENKQFEKLEINGEDYSKESMSKFDVREVFDSLYDLIDTGDLAEKQVCVFMPGVQTAKEFAKLFSDLGIEAQHIDGTCTDDERKQIKVNFEKKNIRVLFNCDVLSASWDSDVIDAVVILRPTLSPAKYLQMIGRALHGKNIGANGEKIPKEEIAVVDAVNTEADITNRNITSRSIKEVLNLPEKTHSRSKIDVKQTVYISDILLYYNVSDLVSEKGISEVFEQFREVFGLEMEDFQNMLTHDRQKLFERTETLEISLASNNKFGESFTNREKMFQIDFQTFYRLLMDYKKLSHIQKFSEKKEKIIGKEATLQQIEKFYEDENLTREELFEKLNNFSITKDKNDLLGKLFGFGYGITKIVTNSGWENLENLDVRTLGGFRAWLCWLFDIEKKEEIRGKEATLKQIETFYENENLTREELFEKLMNFRKIKGKNDLEGNLFGFGYGITKIVTNSGWENPGNLSVGNPGGFRAWLCWLFDIEKKEEIIGKEATLKQIETFYENENLTRDELFKKLYNFGRKDLEGNLFGFGYGITKIVTNSGWEKPENLDVYNSEGLRTWLCWLFDIENIGIIRKEATLKQIEKFYEDENLTKEELCKKLYNFGREDLQGNLFGFDYGIMQIVKNSGWGKPENLRVTNLKGFKAWLCWLFDKESIEIKGKEATLQQIEKFYGDENLTREELFEKLHGLEQKYLRGKDKFGFDYGITQIVKNSGWENPENLDITTLTGFKPWLCWLFDKDFEAEDRKRQR